MSLKKLLIAVGITSTLITGTAYAHEDVKNEAVKARMMAMGKMGGSMKLMGGMMKGQVEFDAAQAQMAVQTIQDMAAKTPALFKMPEMDPKSEATLSIWDNYHDFVLKAQTLEQAAGAVKASITSASDLGAVMGALGKNCKSCHSNYKK